MRGRWFVLACLTFFFSCSLPDDGPAVTIFSVSFDFNLSQAGWQADFTDLPAVDGDSSFYELKAAYTDLPANLSPGKSIMLSGNNHSDDLFMFIKRKVTGLTPNTSYTLVFEVELASNAPTGSVGIGGSPGESVYLKAGASPIEPKRVIEDDRYVINVDKGNQSTSGSNAIVLGNIALPSSSYEYALITRSNATASGEPLIVQTNSAGELWLFVGTESGFEGTTTVYYTKVNVLFSSRY